MRALMWAEVLLLLSVFASPSFAAKAIYRCVQSGQTVLTDQPCPESPADPQSTAAALSVDKANKFVSDLPAVVGDWRGQMQFQGAQSGQQLDAAHSVVPMVLSFTADGKVSGSSGENGCKLLEDLMDFGLRVPPRVGLALAAVTWMIFHVIAVQTGPVVTTSTVQSLAAITLHSVIYVSAFFLQFASPFCILVGVSVSLIKRYKAKRILAKAKDNQSKPLRKCIGGILSDSLPRRSERRASKFLRWVVLGPMGAWIMF